MACHEARARRAVRRNKELLVEEAIVCVYRLTGEIDGLARKGWGCRLYSRRSAEVAQSSELACKQQNKSNMDV
jgi:hypothetical protein